jgi:diguanylate cyclase (GGDEF)-like protein
MEVNEVRGGDRLRLEYPDLGTEAEGVGYSTCWVLPIAIRGTPRPTAALVLWRRSHGDALPHRTTTAGRVARLVALAIESDRNVRALREAASTDSLTGLPNRTAHRESLTGLLAGKPPTTVVSVLFCDLDEFKPVNDEHGHDFGDRVLGIVGERMRATVRAADHVSRWGGDEFLVSTLAADETEVVGLAERLIAKVGEPINLDGLALEVGLSIGIAMAADAASVDALIQAADDALLEAKEQGGKNHWVLHD